MRLSRRAPGGVAPRKPGVKAGWVLMRLRAGDELGSQPGHTVAAHHNLEQLAGVPWREIVEGNGERVQSINDWVLRPLAEGGAGGSRNALGTPVFTDQSAIYLPPSTPRQRVDAAVPVPVKKRTDWLKVAGGVVAFATVIGIAVAASSNSDKKRGGG